MCSGFRIETSGRSLYPEREKAVRLVASTRDEGTPEYSPDGSRIAFSSDQSGSEEIWVARSDGSRQEKLTSFGSGRSGTPRWSPDSGRLVFDSNAEAAQFEIYTINADGGQPRRLTHDPGADAIASFSRDGKWIYFMSSHVSADHQWFAYSQQDHAGSDIVLIENFR